MASLDSISALEKSVLRPITEIAAKLGVTADELELHGRFKAKLPLARIDAARAEKIGLVNEVLPDADAALAAAHATAAEIAANSPLTVRGVKDVLDEQRTDAVAASLRYVAAWNSAFLPSRDLKEAVTAMFEKRPPNFTGD